MTGLHKVILTFALCHFCLYAQHLRHVLSALLCSVEELKLIYAKFCNIAEGSALANVPLAMLDFLLLITEQTVENACGASWG